MTGLAVTVYPEEPDFIFAPLMLSQSIFGQCFALRLMSDSYYCAEEPEMAQERKILPQQSSLETSISRAKIKSSEIE